MIGGLVSLVWCILALTLTTTRIAPKTLMFPEITFASIVAGHQVSQIGRRASVSWDALMNVLSELTNASSRKIRNGLAGLKFHVRVTEPDVQEDGGEGHVSLVVEDGDPRLNNRDDMEGVLTGSGQGRIHQRYSWERLS